MSVPPSLPKLAPKDMQWVRYVNDRIKGLEKGHSTLQSNMQSAITQRQSTQAATSTVVQAQATALTIDVPTAPPQVPNAPLLSTDHGTVTITWDGRVYATMATGEQGNIVTPAIGFNRVDVYRSTNATDGFALINYITNGSTSIVDAAVVVGTTYWYRFVTVDNLKVTSAPGATASITVKGVDLGNLETDVRNAINAAAAAGAAGQDAAAAAANAANSADAKAAAALNSANDAQSRADAAFQAAENATGTQQIVIGLTQPDDTTGNVLWIDTTNGTNYPKRYVNGSWTPLTDKTAIDAANAAYAAQQAAVNAQNSANNAVNVANTANGNATVALQAANGKNKVNYSVDPPSSNNGITGDIWYQYSNNIIIAQWVYSNGGWQQQQLANQVIASLDAGKITTGILSADRIGANSIAAGKLIAGTITADSGILADAVITTAKIADLAVSSAKIANLDAAKIQVGTITADKLAAGSVTSDKIAANSIDANKISAGAVTADKFSATAIDGMTITGAVFRTSGTATSTGVVLDSNGLRAYKSGTQNFVIDNGGNVSMTGYINATGGNFTGYLNAQSGVISGNLTVNGQLITNGSSANNRLIFDNQNVRLVSPNQGVTLNFGTTLDYSYSDYPTSIRWTANGQASDNPNYLGLIRSGTSGGQGYLDLRSGGQINLVSGASDLNLASDASGGRVYSLAIRNRLYASSNLSDSDGNRIVMITSAGTLGILTAKINSNYLSSSSRKYKHDIEDWRPDYRKVLELNPVKFRYNDDNSLHVGMIAEQMEELGLEELVTRNSKGEIQTIEYLFFGAALLHVAREQQKTIDNLQQRLQEAGI